MGSKSLGTLTLDLVARTGGFVQGMDKAGRESAKWRKQVEKDLKTINSTISAGVKAAAAGAVVATGAVVALTTKGMTAVTAQNALAKSLDTTYDSITALNLAAGDVGLEGLEGSLTRLNRRLGAAEDGSGAAAKAVKALNLDLAALSGMNVDERVATIADAIRDSGVSSQRAARFAQDLGFEQQQAAQFFLQGGDAIRAYSKEVDDLGLSLSDLDAQKVQEASNAMGIFGDLTGAAAQRLAVEFSPVLFQVSEDLKAAAIETGGFSDEIGTLVDRTVTGVAFVASSVDATGRVFETLGKTIALIMLHGNQKIYEFADGIYNGPVAAANDLIDTLNLVPGIDITPLGLTGTGQHIKEQLAVIGGAIAEGQADLQAGLQAPLAGDRIIEYYENAKVAAEGAAKAARDVVDAQRPSSGGSLEDPEATKSREADAKKAAAAEKARLEGIAKEITALERAAETWGMSADEIKIYTLEQAGATKAQLEHAEAVLADVAAFETYAELQENYLSLVSDLRTEEEKLTDQLHDRLAVLDAIAAAGGIGSDEYQEQAGRIAGSATEEAPEFGGLDAAVGGAFGELQKIDEAEEKLTEWYETQLELLEEFRQERADLNATWDEREIALKQQHEDELARIEQARQMAQLAATESVFGSLTDIAGTFAGEQSGIYKAMFAIQKAAAIAQSLVAIQTGVALAAANPFPMNLAAMASVAAATAGLVSNIASIGLDGQAHDGIMSVPSDGTWNLKKGERVTTAETSAKLDATLDRVGRESRGGGLPNVQVINNGQPVSARTEMDGNTMRIILDAVEKDYAGKVSSGKGMYSKTNQRAYGLKRAIR